MSGIIKHRQELIDYFLNFCSSQGEIRIGAEFEKLGVFYPSGKAIPYSGRRGVANVLSYLSQKFGWESVKENDKLIALSRKGSWITLEPGSQIELSSSVLNNIHQVKKEWENFVGEIKSFSEPSNIKWLGLGVQPVSRLEDIEWVQKHRYKIMAPYLAKHGELSHHMMKKTASIQVSVDYSDEDDFTRKMRTALCLAPIITAIFANSPISEGKINGFLSERAHIWNYTDPARSGLIGERFFSNPQFSSYVDYALQVPMFFIIRDDQWIEVKKRTFSEYFKKGYQGYRASWDDWELHLSTIFTEVRVKSYIELRCADCQRTQLTPAVVAAWKGILYNEEAIRAVSSLMKGLSWVELHNLYFTVPREGLKAKLKGVRLLDIAKELLKISSSGLKEQRQFNEDGEDESVHLEPIMELIIEDEMCPAEIIIKNWNSSWRRSINKLIEYSSY